VESQAVPWSVGKVRHESKLRPRDRACEQLIGYIESQDLKPGDRLPSERALCEMWDLNRTTLRYAIARLASLGILVSRLGSGTYVAPRKIERALQSMEPFSTSIRQAGYEHTAEVTWSGAFEVDEVAARDLGVERGTSAFGVNVVRYASGIPVVVETEAVLLDACPGIVNCDPVGRGMLKTVIEDLGVHIVLGEGTLTVTYADAAEATHLDVAPGTPLFHHQARGFGSTGRVIGGFRQFINPAYCRLTSDLTRA